MTFRDVHTAWMTRDMASLRPRLTAELYGALEAQCERLRGADLRVARLEDPLPHGPFDLVFSALCIHHLDGPGKADLFRRVAEVLEPGGRFVIGDVVVPDDPADAVTPLSPDYDLPSRVDEQLAWLADAGFSADVVWRARDLAVFLGRTPAG